MSSTEFLNTYLNDHLAGASAAAELIERSCGRNTGTPVGDFLAGLLHDVEADRATLRRLMKRLGVEESSFKQVAGAVLEKASRLKLAEPVTGSPHLTRLMELETVYLGVEGKHALWRTLKALSDDDPRLAETDLEGLIDRADHQLAGIEKHRLEAATTAFTD
ncbi:MAG TPA: hypothetical protein VGR21_09205 [Cryptosporangiaceae bacterium]|nr:hypothetical protein [Cryptosporangiaceae bacterium]